MGRIYCIEYDIPAAPNDGFLYACCHPTCRTHFVFCPPPGFATVRISLSSLFLRLQFLLRTVMKKTMVMAIITTSSSTSSFFACLAQKIPFLVLLKKMPPPNNVYT